MHDSTMRALASTAGCASGCCPQPRCEAFLVSTARHPAASHLSIHEMFNRLVEIAGLSPARRGVVPAHTISDMRFAVSTLLDWYRDGVDVQARLPLLSTYLGHVNPASTFWYLTAAPELLAARRRPARTDHGRTRMSTPLAPTLEAFFTDTAAGPAAREPEHDRIIPRHVPAAAAVRPSRRPAPDQHASSSPNSTRR